MAESETNTAVVEPIIIHATLTREPSTPEAAKPSRGYDVFVTLVDLLKALAWPLIAVMFFFAFNDSIRRTIALVPEKLEKADKANIASLSWEIQPPRYRRWV